MDSVGPDDLSSVLSMDKSLDEDIFGDGLSSVKTKKEIALQHELLRGNRAVNLADVKSPTEMQAESDLLEAIEERDNKREAGNLTFLDGGNGTKSNSDLALISGVSEEVASSGIFETAVKEGLRSSSLCFGKVSEEREVSVDAHSNASSLLHVAVRLKQIQSKKCESNRLQSFASEDTISEVFEDEKKPSMKRDLNEKDMIDSKVVAKSDTAFHGSSKEEDVESQVHSNENSVKHVNSGWTKLNAYTRITASPKQRERKKHKEEEETEEEKEKKERNNDYNDALIHINTLFSESQGFFSRLKAVLTEKQCFRRVMAYCKKLLFYIILPCLGLSTLLFYGFDNPLTPLPGNPSWSWVFLFIIRQSLTYSLSRFTEIFLIDFITLQTKLILWMAGPFVTLLLAQSKGWPLQCTFWALHNLLLLYGDSPFAQHWMYYQDVIRMFNEENPSGDIVTHSVYHKTLIAVLFCGIAITIKRIWFRSLIGRRNYDKYGKRMMSMMRKISLISEVAMLAGEAEEVRYSRSSSRLYKVLMKNKSDDEQHSDGDESGSVKNGDDDYNENRENTAGSFLNDTVLSDSLRSAELCALMGEWEEPELVGGNMSADATISELLGFRYGLDFILQTKHPFSHEFGLADTRLHCAESAQKVYKRLHLRYPESEVLKFDTVCKPLVSEKGKIDEKKAKALIRLFRPDRDGNLLMIDFIRSCDTTYKKLKMLCASISNSSRIDDHIKTTFSIVFYFVLSLVVILFLGGNPFTLLITVAPVLTTFSFLFSSAASKIFQGALLIIVRQPYDVGDRIATSNVDSDSNPGGSTTWFVEGVGLHTTTVRNAGTNEVATIANSSLAELRIINAFRSPKAIVFLDFKFGVDTANEKRELFHTVVEKFVKDRPREWFALAAIRATSVEANRGFIDYRVVAQHRDSWQNVGAILNSRAELASYCLEVTKKLDITYIAPSMPITLSMNSDTNVDVQKEFQKVVTETDIFAKKVT